MVRNQILTFFFSHRCFFLCLQCKIISKTQQLKKQQFFTHDFAGKNFGMGLAGWLAYAPCTIAGGSQKCRIDSQEGLFIHTSNNLVPYILPYSTQRLSLQNLFSGLDFSEQDSLGIDGFLSQKIQKTDRSCILQIPRCPSIHAFYLSQLLRSAQTQREVNDALSQRDEQQSRMSPLLIYQNTYSLYAN